MPHVTASALALALAVMAPDAEPVPIQRPLEMSPRPAETTEPAAEPAPEPSPPTIATEGPATSEPPTTAEPLSTASGVIEGILTDTEYTGVPMAGVNVVLQCSCLEQPVQTFTDVDGHYRVEDLPSGIYTVLGERGGRPTERVVAVAPGERVTLDFRVGPPTTTEELDRRREEETRAQTLLSVGGVSALGGILLLIGAGVENAKRDCQFGLEDCPAAPRPQVTRGLAVGGLVALVGGTALVALGVHKKRRLRASIAADDRSAALVLTGRF